MYYGFSKKFLISAFILVFIVAPAAAWAYINYVYAPAYLPVDNPPERSLASLQQAVDKYDHDLPADQQQPDLTVKSYKRYNNWWYVVDVTSPAYHDQTLKMLIGDFYKSPDRLQVITDPGEQMIDYNISGMGVPYAALDDINSVKEVTGDE
ncbi:MAG TPA: hypothetical protein VFK03_02740 [Candidatus Saccharimonadales bacterium]|nr:hypothetical protein [Candidatus Saccharimonadales bacterium]